MIDSAERLFQTMKDLTFHAFLHFLVSTYAFSGDHVLEQLYFFEFDPLRGQDPHNDLLPRIHLRCVEPLRFSIILDFRVASEYHRLAGTGTSVLSTRSLRYAA